MGTTSNMAIPYPESTDFVADGATAMENLADQVDVKTGLVLIKTQAVPASPTQSSITVTDAFSSKFDAYRILWTGGNGNSMGSGANLRLDLGIGTTFTTTGYYDTLVRVNASALYAAQNDNVAYWNFAGGVNNSIAVLDIELQNPNLAVYTTGRSHYQNIGGGNYGTSTFFQASTTQFTSFRITPSTQTVNNGVVRVYGYNNG